MKTVLLQIRAEDPRAIPTLLRYIAQVIEEHPDAGFPLGKIDLGSETPYGDVEADWETIGK
jgi:hypothetical protein